MATHCAEWGLFLFWLTRGYPYGAAFLYTTARPGIIVALYYLRKPFQCIPPPAIHLDTNLRVFGNLFSADLFLIRNFICQPFSMAAGLTILLGNDAVASHLYALSKNAFMAHQLP
jgi:hypothetical protein